MSSNNDDPNAAARSDRERRDRIRFRHNVAAKDGRHLPSSSELIVGGSFMSADIFTDAKTFVERAMPRIDQGSLPGAEVHHALAAITVHPKAADFLSAADVCRRAGTMKHYLDPEHPPADPQILQYRGPDLESMAERMDYYAASMGSKDGCVRVAKHAILLARENGPADMCNLYFEAAVGWLAVAEEAHEFSVRRGGVNRWDDMRNSSSNAARVLLDEFTKYQGALTSDAAASVVERKVGDKVVRSGRGMIPAVARGLDIDSDLLEIMGLADAPPKPGLVVIKEVGSPDTHEGMKISAAYKTITGVRLTLPLVPDLSAVRAKMAAEFPHAVRVLDGVLRDLDGRDYVRIRPTVFVGKPGCGKTTFATRLLAELGVGHQIYPCGGVADSTLAGTARQWTSGGPSMPAALVARYRTAAPGIVLDEISRAASGTQNGRMTDALLSLIEPISACRYLDPYLQSECDLSAVIWLGTCNDLESLPAALRDRFRIITFPSPSPEHMPALASGLLRRAVADLGLSAAWAQPLDGVELGALAGTWGGGSLRGLRKLVEGVLNARDQISVRQ